MLRFSKIILSTLCLAIISSGYANCPEITNIKRYALGHAGFYWYGHDSQGNGWVGYAQGSGQDTAIDRFDHAIWWNYQDKTPTALCFYIGNQGSLIQMSEGNWNRLVSKPKDKNWSPCMLHQFPAASCYADITTCGFTYY